MSGGSKISLNFDKMNETAQFFVGLNNFKSFTDDKQEQGSTKVEIKFAAVEDFGNLLVFHVIGSHFIWKQVRRMTGVVVEAGRGNMKPSEVLTFFRNKSDIPAKLTAPPSGLFLERVYYNEEDIVFTTKPVINII